MKNATCSEEDLLRMEYEDTGMRIGNNEVWQNHDERIIYDPESQMIVARYTRERRNLYGNSGGLAVGQRQ